MTNKTHILELRDRPGRYIKRKIVTSGGSWGFRLTNNQDSAYRFTPDEAAELVTLWRGQINLIAWYSREEIAA